MTAREQERGWRASEISEGGVTVSEVAVVVVVLPLALVGLR